MLSDPKEIVAAIKDERESRREILRGAVERNPAGKLARKAGMLLLDMEMLDERVGECGGKEGFVFMLCAQVAGGVTLSDFCGHYGLQRGLVWALLSENEGWMGMYRRSLMGMADEWVSEVVGIADRADVEGVVVDKLKIETRLKVGQMYDGERFGKQSKVKHEHSVDFGERLRRAQERVIEGEVLSAEPVLVEAAEVDVATVVEPIDEGDPL